MKKAMLISGLTILTSLFGGTIIASASGSGTVDDPAKGTVTIEFIENTTVTPPVDPKDPTKPNPEELPDSENNKTGVAGPLSLDVYPSQFDFGVQNIDLSGGVYSSTKNGSHYLQVTDNRDKLGGWTIMMLRTEFTDGASSLTGSSLYIPSGIARNTLTADPTASDINAKLGIAEGTGAFAGMYEISTVESKLFGYENDLVNLTGKGTTTYSWNSNAEKLQVPAGVAKQGTFTSTINWILTADAWN
ncbi:WxL domain-containing protein [Enterococcus casseliflavus]|nr:WxL domain-containing protein [Enterococcus casseliflavus]